jgi:hypothetical protein
VLQTNLTLKYRIKFDFSINIFDFTSQFGLIDEKCGEVASDSGIAVLLRIPRVFAL